MVLSICFVFIVLTFESVGETLWYLHMVIFVFNLLQNLIWKCCRILSLTTFESEVLNNVAPFCGTGKSWPRSTSSWIRAHVDTTLQTIFPCILEFSPWMVRILPVKVILWSSGVSKVTPSARIISKYIRG